MVGSCQWTQEMIGGKGGGHERGADTLQQRRQARYKGRCGEPSRAQPSAAEPPIATAFEALLVLHSAR